MRRIISWEIKPQLEGTPLKKLLIKYNIFQSPWYVNDLDKSHDLGQIWLGMHFILKLLDMIYNVTDILHWFCYVKNKRILHHLAANLGFYN